MYKSFSIIKPLPPHFENLGGISERSRCGSSDPDKHCMYTDAKRLTYYNGWDTVLNPN